MNTTNEVIAFIGNITDESVFSEDISDYNLYSLVKWVDKCRAACTEELDDEELKALYEQYKKYTIEHKGIEDPNRASEYVISFDAFEDTYRTLYDISIAGFSEKWEQHANKHRLVYKSRTYKQAVLCLALQPITYSLSFSTGEKIPCTNIIKNYLCNMVANIPVCKAIDKVEQKHIRDYEKAIEELLSMTDKKTTLRKLLGGFCCNKIEVAIQIPEGVDCPDISNEKAFQAFLVKQDKYKLQEKKSNFIIDSESSYTAYIQNVLPKHHINKNIYYEYVNGSGKRLIKKDFFENLAFFLGLSLEQAQKLLLSEGYSIVGSTRQDDTIVALCYECGFPQRLANNYLIACGCNTINIMAKNTIRKGRQNEK